jgi:hypothetical protein
MAVEVDIDVEVLRCEIKKTYARVSQEPEEDFIFPTGRAWICVLHPWRTPIFGRAAS